MEGTLYHMVPPNMEGHILHPLNNLASAPGMRHVYDKGIRKYARRPHAMRLTIPLLDCLWNDVIHMTPCDPRDTARAVRKAGCEWPPTQYFAIPISHLDVNHAVIYTYQTMDAGSIPHDEIIPFTLDALCAHTTVTQRTKDYYRRVHDSNPPGTRRPLLYHGMPHVLYKGSIDVSQCDILNAR